MHPQQEVREYWERVLDRVDRPSALGLIPNLDLSHPLGFKAGIAAAKGSSQLVPFMIETKRGAPHQSAARPGGHPSAPQPLSTST